MDELRIHVSDTVDFIAVYDFFSGSRMTVAHGDLLHYLHDVTLKPITHCINTSSY